MLLLVIALLRCCIRGVAEPIEVERAQRNLQLGGEGIVLNATGYIIAAHKIELAPRWLGGWPGWVWSGRTR